MRSNAKLGRVLAIYASASFAVLQVVDLFQDRLDLPDWVFPAAVVLLIVGLPIVVLTALVQAHDFSPFIERHFTWKRALIGGVLAFLVLGLSAAAFVGSRALGIGPGASLVSSGVLSDADRIVIAQFDGPATDSALTTMFTEAVRMSLGNSDKIKPLAPAEIGDALTMMKLPKTTLLKSDVAKDVALRLGAKAIVNGSLARVGNSFITTLTLQSPVNGETLFSSSATADDAGKLIASIDKLARRMRKKIGDSLKDLRDEPALAKATTSSLEALKKYSLGFRAAAINGDLDKAVRLYEEAIALDSTFALAYVRLGSSRINRGDPPARTKEVLTTAYRLRERLPLREQRTVEAYYTFQVRGDHSKAVEIYTAMLDDGDSSVLNNLGHQLSLLGRYREAEKYLRLAILRKDKSYYPFSNLADVELNIGNVEAADSIVELLNKTFPGHPRYYRVKSSIAVARERYDEAKAHMQHLLDSPLPSIHAEGVERMSYHELMRGRASRSRALTDELIKTRQAKKDGPTVLAARARTALALALSGNKDAARKELEAALIESPFASIDQADRPYRNVQNAWVAIGDANQVRAVAAQALPQWDPVKSRSDSVWLAGWSFIAAGDGQSALRLTADTAGIQGPALLQLLRGRAFELLGQRDSAIGAYAVVANRVSSGRNAFDGMYLGDTYERLAGLYQQRGDIANAKKYYLKLVNLWKDGEGEFRQRAQRASAQLSQLVER